MIIRDAAKLIDEQNPPPVSLLVKAPKESETETPEEE